MAKRRSKHGPRGVEQGPRGVEWIGGVISMPAYVVDEEPPYRPEALVWMGPEGKILGCSIGRPGEAAGMICRSLQETIDRPIWGEPHTPARVRVASAELAEALRVGRPDLEVTCAPTPELDEMLPALREMMAKDGPGEQSYLSPGVEPEAMAGFFRAAAGLYRAAPWDVVPSDQDLFSVSVEPGGPHGAVLSVIGQLGESFGFLLFANMQDFEAYLDATIALEAGETPELPPQLALNFERGATLPAPLRKEIAVHGWEVARADAYPELMAVDEDLVARPPTAREVAMVEAIARALTEVLQEGEALRAAWAGGEPVARSLQVDTSAGQLKVTLRAPHEGSPGQTGPAYDLLTELMEVEETGEESGPAAREALEEELIARFAASPEARDLEVIGACRTVMELAGFQGQTITTLGPAGLREILFEIIPSTVIMDPSEAGGVVDELRAFYAFLKREFALEQAGACQRVLGPKAVARLEAALADRGKFGMAKSLVMAGREAGFAMDTPEGLEAWLRSVQDKPLPDSVHLPWPGGGPTRAKKAAGKPRKKGQAVKKKRKAARQARKKTK